MPIGLVAHGKESGRTTFVPKGMTLQFLAGPSHRLRAATGETGLRALARGVPARQWTETAGSVIDNQYLGPVDDDDFARAAQQFVDVGDLGKLQAVGGDWVPKTTLLCTSPRKCLETHTCRGALALLARHMEPDGVVYLLACRSGSQRTVERDLVTDEPGGRGVVEQRRDLEAAVQLARTDSSAFWRTYWEGASPQTHALLRTNTAVRGAVAVQVVLRAEAKGGRHALAQEIDHLRRRPRDWIEFTHNPESEAILDRLAHHEIPMIGDSLDGDPLRSVEPYADSLHQREGSGSLRQLEEWDEFSRSTLFWLVDQPAETTVQVHYRPGTEASLVHSGVGPLDADLDRILTASTPLIWFPETRELALGAGTPLILLGAVCDLLTDHCSWQGEVARFEVLGGEVAVRIEG
ncbi:hypothetical protein [Streptomyces sp. NPDC059918]|uniref:hypothetical protein n=1 Tax=unclassified Streptomyces TaxID=2593676 RepID=UPI00365D4763